MKGLVIAFDKGSALELIGGAKAFCERTSLITFSEAAAVSADTAYVIQAESPVCCVEVLRRILVAEDADMVLVQQNIDGRFLSAVAAAQLQTSVLADCTALFSQDGKICSRRMSYGGSAFQTECPRGKIVACVCGGAFESAAEAACPDIKRLEAAHCGGITLCGRTEKAVQHVNLSAAKRVVGVGRGIGSPENLRLAEALAACIGAELACTRPISEEEGWMSRERYVGVSGLMIKPALYISLGISGQIQHTVGINQSGLIISINRDKAAPMFQQSDYGIVGDLNETVPRLIALLKQENEGTS